MFDPFGRKISYLRVSVTDRCDFRCHYCMAEDMTFLPKNDVLSIEELDRLCSAFVAKGIQKIRLTGGEPLLRPDIYDIVRYAADRKFMVVLGTNGTMINHENARRIKEAGAHGVRVRAQVRSLVRSR